jgi:hypothetical protein
MKPLAKLFGSTARVKIMRLFIFNENEAYDAKDVATRTRVPLALARKEAKALEKAGLMRRKSIRKAARSGSKFVSGWTLAPEFPYLAELRALLTDTAPASRTELGRKLSKAGRVKLLIVSGVFTGDTDSRVDMLIVGDRLKRKELEAAMRDIEAETGKELAYAVFDTEDFRYRLGVGDKLLRDIMEYPHEKIVNRLSI